MMPVSDLKLRYIKPYYDDEITLITKVCKMIPGFILNTKCKIQKEITTVAETTLVFVDCETGKPCLIPNFKSKIETYFC